MNGRLRMHFLLCLKAFLLLVLPGIGADDNSPAIDEKSGDKPAVEPGPDLTPKEKSLLQKLRDELLEEVDDVPGGNPDPSKQADDKMDRAVKGMRSAGGKLDDGLTAEETQKIQKQVIQDLEDIINQLENPPPPPPKQNGGGGGGGGANGGGGAGGGGGRNRRGGGGSSLRRRQPQGAGGQGSVQRQNARANQEEKESDTANENGKDSSKKTREGQKADEEAARRQKLEMDIWGHLPPQLREELLNTYGERMLPKYEHLVKQFYEALSTQKDPEKTR